MGHQEGQAIRVGWMTVEGLVKVCGCHKLINLVELLVFFFP